MTLRTRNTLNALLLAGACAALAPALTGCVPVAAVGVGAGALALSDRRPTETYIADEAIETRAVNRLNEKFGDKAHINITSYNHAVLLTGEVPSEAAKAEVEKVIAGVPNVRAITNELLVAGPSSFGARSNDTYITSKVKARFIDANKFAPYHVKVVTEAGTVYLLGQVTQRESDTAVEIARTTGGVQKVVRVFEIISEEAARKLDNPPVNNAPAEQPAAAKK
ncbi:MAG: BON domain-containing protein [Rhodocyclaceae bacterium]|nr:BON domain-containing protein [Rhodocyclaceae bacterium]